MVGPVSGSTETQRSEQLAIDHAVGRHVVIAFVSANRTSRFRPQNAIDGTMIIPRASEPALYLDHQPHIGVSVVVVTVVVVRVVRIRVRIEDGKAKRVDEDESPFTEVAEMLCARHCPRRKTRCWPCRG